MDARRRGKVVVREMNARIRNEKYKPRRWILETLIGYQEASKCRTLDEW
jgi:hypothetical protein